MAEIVRARILGPQDGDIMGPPDGVTDRFQIEAQESGGHFALIEHRMATRALAAPLHLHTREDEYSYVLEGRVGALLGEQEFFGQAGDLIFKPRGQWHTFWNAGDAPARIFTLGAMPSFPDPEALAALAAEYGGQVDFERTLPIIERHGLVF
jgi:quercetin dioxygenase-like cupin family protein